MGDVAALHQNQRVDFGQLFEQVWELFELHTAYFRFLGLVHHYYHLCVTWSHDMSFMLPASFRANAFARKENIVT